MCKRSSSNTCPALAPNLLRVPVNARIAREQIQNHIAAGLPCGMLHGMWDDARRRSLFDGTVSRSGRRKAVMVARRTVHDKVWQPRIRRVWLFSFQTRAVLRCADRGRNVRCRFMIGSRTSGVVLQQLFRCFETDPLVLR